MMETELTPLLNTLRQQLAHTLGEQFGRVMLFGSRARGEARPDSDIDVLVIVPGEVNYMELLRRTSALVAELSLAHDVVISPVFISQAQFEQGGSPFARNVRREAVAL